MNPLKRTLVVRAFLEGAGLATLAALLGVSLAKVEQVLREAMK